VIYGPATEPKSVSVDRKALLLAYRAAGESTLVDLSLDGGKPLKVLIQDLQYDPLTSEIIHADFRAVDLTKEITANIKLHFVGEAAAVKELGGTMIHALDEIEVRALPTALVHSIDVDVSKLKTFDETIKVADLVLPSGITLVDDLNETIAVVAPPRSEEELAELNKAVEVDVTAVEVEKKEKKEEEEAAEGAAPTEEKKIEEKK
jgi:large subunit ribosomal protein L25